MITYLIKSSLGLLILYLGYLLVSKEKRFRFNRIYLLFSLIFSLVIPVVPVDFATSIEIVEESHPLVQSMYSGSAEGFNWSQTNSVESYSQGWTISHVLLSLYLVGFTIMLSRYIRNFLTINRLIRTSTPTIYKGVKVRLLKQQVSPYSFGPYVFLSKSDYQLGRIDEQIMQHEMAHVRQYHTWDIVLIELVLVFYWFNPLLWLYRFAIRINHEFQADQAVLHHSDVYSYADLLVSTHQRNTISLFGSPFNFLLTKKRLLMMNRSKSAGINFGYRLTGTLCIFLTSFFLLSFGNRDPLISKHDGFVVVIDVGHGGEDIGSQNQASTVNEKDIVLAIAKQLKIINPGPGVSFVFTRDHDKRVSLTERVDYVNKVSPDLVVSLHTNVNHNNPEMRGVEVYYSNENMQNVASKIFSNIFRETIRLGQQENLMRSIDFKITKDVVCPSVLLELGFLSNKKDLAYLTAVANQRLIAEQIVTAVQRISKL